MSQPDWRRPWQQQLETRRQIEMLQANMGAEARSDITRQQRRRFQRIEFLKGLAWILGLLLLCAAIGLFFTFVVPLVNPGVGNR